MLFSSRFRHRTLRSIRRPLWVPRLEALEDRIVLSTLTVTSAADDGSAGTLRAVLAAVHNGDTIRFAHQLDGQTIMLKQGQLTVDQSVNINGPEASQLTISGNAVSRIFDIGSGTSVTISGLTLTDGLAADGGGILNAGNLTLCQDTLTGNVAQGSATGGLFGDNGGRGGGVENQAGATLHVQQILFTDNQALGGTNGGNAFGGGIYNEAGSVTIDQGTLNGNQAVAANGGTAGVEVTLPGGSSATLLGVGMGGDVWNDGGSLTVTDSTLNGNLAQGGSNGDGSSNKATFLILGAATGGAVGSGSLFTTATPSLAIAGSSLSGNQSQGGSSLTESVPLFSNLSDIGYGRGGAIGTVVGNVALTNSTIAGNTAQGGALFTDILNGKTIQQAGSNGDGGGIDDEFDFGLASPTTPPSLVISGSTIKGNSALGIGPSGGGMGGGLNTGNVTAHLIDSTMSGNQAVGAAGGGFVVFSFSGFTFAFNSGGGGGTGGGIASFSGSLTIGGSAIEDNVAQGGSGVAQAAQGGDGIGGAISSSSQTFMMTNSLLSGNQALGGDATQFDFGFGGQASGGAFTMSGGDSATISGTTFRNNLALGGLGSNQNFGGNAQGGAAEGTDSSLVLTDSSFTGNEAISSSITQGGGLVIFGTNANISNTLFAGNLAKGDSEGVGGGLEVVARTNSTGATPIVSNCCFVQNTAQGGIDAQGGGMFVSGFTTMSIQGSTFVADKAVGGDNVSGFGGGGGFAVGGGLDIDSKSIVQVSQCSFRLDAALGGNGGAGTSGAGGFAQGGGVNVDFGSTATISDAVFVANLAQGGAGGAALAARPEEPGGMARAAASATPARPRP